MVTSHLRTHIEGCATSSLEMENEVLKIIYIDYAKSWFFASAAHSHKPKLPTLASLQYPIRRHTAKHVLSFVVQHRQHHLSYSENQDSGLVTCSFWPSIYVQFHNCFGLTNVLTKITTKSNLPIHRYVFHSVAYLVKIRSHAWQLSKKVLLKLTRSILF